MKKRKLLALASACALLVGTGTTVLATGSEEYKTGSTAVTLSVTSYTLTVPSTVAINRAGYTALGEGITVQSVNNDWNHDVKVSATSDGGWNFKNATDEKAEVKYILCNREYDDTKQTDFTFENYKIHWSNGETITPYIYVTTDDYNNAKDGEYKDTITFTVTAITNPTEAPATSEAPYYSEEAPATSEAPAATE